MDEKPGIKLEPIELLDDFSLIGTDIYLTREVTREELGEMFTPDSSPGFLSGTTFAFRPLALVRANCAPASDLAIGIDQPRAFAISLARRSIQAFSDSE